MSNIKRIFHGLAIVAIITTVFFTSSCFFPAEPLLTIRISNQTDQTLRIFSEGEVFVGDISPGGELKYKTDAIYLHYSVVAKDIQGNIVYSANFTKEDIGGKKTYHIVVPRISNSSEKSDNVTP
jgi:hypothetical protein